MRTAVILAGGKARRFSGQPKPLLPIGTKRIIDRQMVVLNSVADYLAIVTNDRVRYGALGVPVWQDLAPDTGPLGGIYTALKNTTTAQTLVVAGDLPFLTAPFLQYLMCVCEDADVAIPRMPNGLQPLCAIYARRCIEIIRHQIKAGRFKVTDVLSKLNVREVGPDEIAHFDSSGTLFFNINTPDDYQNALALASNRLTLS